MIRFAFFLLLALALVAALFYVDTALGWIDIGLGGNVYEVRSGFLIVGVMLVSLALVLVWRLAAVIWSAPARSRRALAHARNARGAEGVETALIALAAGDAAHARQAAIKARKQLDNPLAARVLAAQAAEAMKDRPTAEAEFASLLESEKAQVAARRGLAAAAAEKGDTAAVIAHAKFAFEANPAAKWAFEALFDAQVSGAAWEEALASLTSGEKHGHIAHDAAKRRRAVLYAAQAAREEDLAEMDKALMAAEKSTQDAPGFAPGAALAARLFMMHNKGWRAAGVLENAWETAPHPAIALAYRDLKENEAVKARVKRMMGLVQIQPEHRESRILAAELHLLAGEGPAAQLVLDKVLKREEPSARLCGLAAQVAQATGDLAAAHEWIQRAGSARREPDWSDLDPEGPAFAYEPGDWARLVYSFGDSGELIHPRHERYEPEKDTVPSDPAVGLPPPKGPVETEAEYESAPAGRAPGPEDAPVADDEASPDATENEATEVTAEEDDAGGRRRGVFRRR